MYRIFFLPAAIMQASMVASPRKEPVAILKERPIDLKTAVKQGTTLVLGLGNVIMGDEGVGVHVVRAIEKHPLPANIECLDGGTGGFTLLEPLQSAARVILIDAASDGNPLGTVTRTTPRFSRDYPPTLTAHDIGVKDLLDVFYIQGGGPDVVLYAITIDPKQPISMELSEGTAQAADVAVAKILAELERNSAA
jgi:hydrogenase maturation protease